MHLFGPEPIDPELTALPALAVLLVPDPLPSDSVGDPPSPVEPAQNIHGLESRACRVEVLMAGAGIPATVKDLVDCTCATVKNLLDPQEPW